MWYSFVAVSVLGATLPPRLGPFSVPNQTFGLCLQPADFVEKLVW
jgi:hypothetical protein